ncbi:MAG: electron transfer flavoprotein subunit alpha/FixB family protein [Candidatus Dactylopiibacterium sp.]|nr:electron transfer flavoprotein subunit alpha/FixB family protein [Candidatus Dactylopiibacterium sp.]
MKILLVADHDEGMLSPLCARLLGAVRAFDAHVDVLVAGFGCERVAAAAAGLAGVARVRVLDDARYADGLPENLAMMVAQIAAAYSHVLFSSSCVARRLAPRVAAMLDVAPMTGVVALLGADRFVRASHAGRVLETVHCAEPVKVLGLQAASFTPMPAPRQAPAPIEPLASGPEMGVSRRLAQQRVAQAGLPALASARVVVAGGLGLGSAEAFGRLLLPLAARLGAAAGATQAAIAAGFAPAAWLIGQAGHVVAPELYVAVGISGAPEHLAGVRGARRIVAINADASAPLMALADLACVGEAEQTLPRLLEVLGA